MRRAGQHVWASSTKGLDHEPQEGCLQPGLQQDDQRVLGAGGGGRWRSGCCGRRIGYDFLNPEVTTMKPDLVEKLEEVLEQAIADALDSKKLKKLPVKPRREITHLMAKAAVAVYEGVVEGKNG